ncbi:superoxide dismutase [Ni] [Marinifilum flexuosum]|uniref:Nickel superoxide dismutase n=1 Tax=Marinifilum flexuosum TaxID=1117708 RepID=A0A419XB19_9BACT|nr:superoxide dismutase [Ni] [Marinifilum flexuosum]RKE04944.1 nickel superoxide dismutase [Marinifilum flexuosum]
MRKLIRTAGLGLVFVLFLIVGNQKNTFAHCEVPCGIYADSVRVVLMSEHITTIEKSMKKIVALSAEENVNYNQLVRWVNNKEEHAKKLQEIATQYFMFQRVKLTDDAEKMKKNQKLLAKLHEICVYAMKAKQTTDLNVIKKLNNSVHDFSHLYFGPGKHHHHHH